MVVECTTSVKMAVKRAADYDLAHPTQKRRACPDARLPLPYDPCHEFSKTLPGPQETLPECTTDSPAPRITSTTVATKHLPEYDFDQQARNEEACPWSLPRFSLEPCLDFSKTSLGAQDVFSNHATAITVDNALQPQLRNTATEEESPRLHLTRSTTLQMSINAVLNTGELLEKIITTLPLSSQGRLRRVNKLWNHIVFTSPHILTPFRFEIESPPPPPPPPRPDSKISKIIIQEPPVQQTSDVTIDPLFKKSIWVFDVKKETLRRYDSVQKSTRASHPWKKRQLQMKPSILNHHLFSLDPLRGGLMVRAERCESIRFKESITLYAPTCTSEKVVRGNEVLERNMLICSPPVQEVQVCFEYRTFSPPTRFNSSNGSTKQQLEPLKSVQTFARVVRVHRPSGIRYGDLLDSFFIACPEDKKENVLQPSFGGRYELVTEPTVGSGGRGSCVWMLGALFVDDEEKESVMGKKRK